MVRAELQLEVPMCVSLPIEVLSPEQAFPFWILRWLTWALSTVKERVVWVDSKRTRVRNKSGKLKEKEVMVLEVRVKAQQPGEQETQEVLYSTETHTDRSYCRSSVAVLPWKQTQPESDYQPVETTLALDMEVHPKWQKTEEKQEV